MWFAIQFDAHQLVHHNKLVHQTHGGFPSSDKKGIHTCAKQNFNPLPGRSKRVYKVSGKKSEFQKHTVGCDQMGVTSVATKG